MFPLSFVLLPTLSFYTTVRTNRRENGVIAMSEQEAVSATSWYVRCCRRLSPVLLYVWGTLIASIFVGTITNLNTTTTDTPLSRFFIVHLMLVSPIPVFSCLGFLVILTLMCGVGKGKTHISGPVSLLKQNRMRFLTKLYNQYTDILEQALQGVDQITLTLHSAPDAVLNTTRARFHQVNLLGQTVPDGTTVVQLYDQASGELLILGDPGCGKTTLLFR